MSDQESEEHSDTENKTGADQRKETDENEQPDIAEVRLRASKEWRVDFTLEPPVSKKTLPWRTVLQPASLVTEVQRCIGAFAKPVEDSLTKYANLPNNTRFSNAIEAVATQVTTFAMWRLNRRSTKGRGPVYPALIAVLRDQPMIVGSDEVIAWVIFSLTELVHCVSSGDADGTCVAYEVPPGQIAICKTKPGKVRIFPMVVAGDKNTGSPSALIFSVPSPGAFTKALKASASSKRKSKPNEAGKLTLRLFRIPALAEVLTVLQLNQKARTV